MTEQTQKHVRRRRSQLKEKRRKIRLVLLAFVLLAGSGALLFHGDGLNTLNGIFNWFKQNNPGEIIASTPPQVIRGDIYDRNFRPLAVTYETYAIYARPLEMEDHDSSAAVLSEILGLEKDKLLANLKSERGFIWIATGIDQEVAISIESRKIKGIYQVAETKRFYPNSIKASHVIGFVENGQGLDGVEFQYNTILRGDEINSHELEALNFKPGTEFGEYNTHLVLNLDLMLQSNIEDYLDKRIKITGASSGSVILMDANTGAVLALASYPAFNPNRYWEFPSSSLRNNALAEPVYPGDLSRIFQQAAAINLQNEIKLLPNDNLSDTDPAVVIVPEKQKKRKLSSAPAVDYVDEEYFALFTEQLGYGHELDTDLPLKDETPVSSACMINNPSFNSSALRLLNGFTTLLNGGRPVTPHLIHKAYQKEKNSPIETKLSSSEQSVVLHPETSEGLSDFLAAKWLKLNWRERISDTPMFLESHRYSIPAKNDALQEASHRSIELSEQAPYLTQSVMLGAIPGKNPKLTMIAVLSYPEGSDQVYPEALEALGNKFSILSPDRDLVNKMLYVAASSPPNPSPDFWDIEGTVVAKNTECGPLERKDSDVLPGNLNKNMPDVTGKSLRAGLQVLQHFNLDIKLVGSGRIISQVPPAGTGLMNVTECTLTMQQKI